MAEDYDPVTALTTRDALAKALHKINGCPRNEPCSADKFDYEDADALLTSGAVVDAATLADDEALVDRAARAMLYRWPADEPVVEGDRDQARRALRALAATISDGVPA